MYKCSIHKSNEGYTTESGEWNCWFCYENTVKKISSNKFEALVEGKSYVRIRSYTSASLRSNLSSIYLRKYSKDFYAITIALRTQSDLICYFAKSLSVASKFYEEKVHEFQMQIT